MKSVKCRAKNPALCVDPQCPEKRSRLASLHKEFNSKLDKFIPASDTVSVATKIETVGFGGEIKKTPTQIACESALTAANEFFEYNYDIQILSHSVPTLGENLTLKDMSDPINAQANCWAVANEIMEVSSPHDFGANELEIVSLQNEKDYHAALYMTIGKSEVVVDYTARQFDPNLPFPLVASLADWKTTIGNHLGHDTALFIGEYDSSMDEENDDELAFS